MKRLFNWWFKKLFRGNKCFIYSVYIEVYSKKEKDNKDNRDSNDYLNCFVYRF